MLVPTIIVIYSQQEMLWHDHTVVALWSPERA